MNQEAEFHKALNVLARLANFELSEDVIEMYDSVAEEIGYRETTDALRTIIMKRRSRDAFPSISEIKEIANPTVSDEAQAESAAALICAAVTKHGYTWGWSFERDAMGNLTEKGAFDFGQEIERKLGTLGKKTVERMGGWARVADELGRLADVSTHRAQIKRVAKMALEELKAGIQTPLILGPRGEQKQIAPRTQGLLAKADPTKLLPPKK